MTRLLAVALAALFLLFPALASATAPARLTPKQAARELRLLERALTDLHPGLYRYQTEAGLAAEFAAARAQVAEGAEPGEMFLLATRLTASVRCGHTWTNPLNQSEAMQAVLADLPALPVRVRLLQGRLLVTASADAAMHRHDEILAIDGRSVTSLVAELMPYLRADGSSDGKRLSQIDSVAEGGVLDRLLPLLHAPQDGVYVLRLRAAAGGVRTVHVRGQHVADREKTLLAAGLAEEDIRWRLTFAGDTATLTLPTFAFWNSEFDWRGFLQRSFDTLTERHVTRLIIDLRQNEGGDSAVGNALVSYLIAAPHALPVGRVESAYERVPYDLAHYLDTWDFSFFDRTGLVERSPGQRNWRLKAQPAPVVLMPRAPRFAGKTIALIGPRMSSAGYLVARDLQASHAATLIGEPTGGNRRGLNGGELAWLTLPYSGVSIDIPLIAAVYEGAPDTGVTPDRVVPTTIEDVIAGRDAVMAAARR